MPIYIGKQPLSLFKMRLPWHFEINVDTNVLPICNCENYSVSSGWVYQREYIR
jgi:hypothetical protein